MDDGFKGGKVRHEGGYHYDGRCVQGATDGRTMIGWCGDGLDLNIFFLTWNPLLEWFPNFE